MPPGVYTVRKAPHEWPDVETLVDNNFRNMFARDAENDGIDAAKKERCGRFRWALRNLMTSKAEKTMDLDPVPKIQRGRILQFHSVSICLRSFPFYLV